MRFESRGGAQPAYCRRLIFQVPATAVRSPRHSVHVHPFVQIRATTSLVLPECARNIGFSLLSSGSSPACVPYLMSHALIAPSRPLSSQNEYKDSGAISRNFHTRPTLRFSYLGLSFVSIFVFVSVVFVFCLRPAPSRCSICPPSWPYQYASPHLSISISHSHFPLLLTCIITRRHQNEI
ncbi:hypothetical protein C8R43DRAFT_1000206 [Mycena crocata]|nr:hypothetical protein C8R43DRAFT_1000206 [Mycena crocata]